jgi:hypothetical protein
MFPLLPHYTNLNSPELLSLNHNNNLTQNLLYQHLTYDKITWSVSVMLYRYYMGHCPLSEVYMINIIFQGFVLLPSSGDWLSLY